MSRVYCFHSLISLFYAANCPQVIANVWFWLHAPDWMNEWSAEVIVTGCHESYVWLTLFFERENLLPVWGMWARRGDGQISPEGVWIPSRLTSTDKIKALIWDGNSNTSFPGRPPCIFRKREPAKWLTSPQWIQVTLSRLWKKTEAQSSQSIFSGKMPLLIPSLQKHSSLLILHFFGQYFSEKKKFKSPKLNAF